MNCFLALAHAALSATAATDTFSSPLGEHAEPASLEASAPASSSTANTLSFGSYGRVAVGADGRGGTGQPVRLVGHAPRLLEASYIELDVGYGVVSSDGRLKLTPRLTLALGDELFHYTGEFDASLAVRNLYVEATGLADGALAVWVGSRMARGDDVYLLDFWPLDELNTVGGGARLLLGETQLAAHAGMSRVDALPQTQVIAAPSPTVGAQDVLLLDRPRAVAAARAERAFTVAERWTLKPVFYVELHRLAEGTVQRDDGRFERLAADAGWLAGAELALARRGSSDSVKLFVRQGRDLAVYDELAVPKSVSPNGTTEGARDFVVATTASVQTTPRTGIQLGGYARYVKDADRNRYDFEDGWETAVAARPAYFLTDHIHVLAEASVQQRWPNGTSPVTGEHDKPRAFQAALMPALTLEPGLASRPQLRLVYAATWLNQAARDSYAATAPQHQLGVQHYIGATVEWWFNSSRMETER